MKLDYSLPSPLAAQLNLESEETIQYCVPVDLAPSGKKVLLDGWLVVTQKRIAVFEGGVKTADLLLSEWGQIRCDPQVGCGILYAEPAGTQETDDDQVREGEKLLARFSMKHIVRCSYVARGARILANGGKRKVVALEREKVCPKCGRALPGTEECLKCDGRMVTFRKFWDLASAYKWKFLVIGLFTLVVAGLRVFQPELQKRFIDTVLLSGNGTLKAVGLFAVVYLAVAFSLLALQVLQNILCTALGSRISMDLRAKLYQKIQSLSLSFLNRRKPGDLINRVTNDTNEIRNFMDQVLSGMFQTMLSMGGALAVMIALNWKLTLISVIFLPLVATISMGFWRQNWRRFRRQFRRSDRLYSQLQDVVSGIRVVKSYGREESETLKFRTLTRDFSKIQVQNEVFFAVLFPLLNFVMGFGLFFVTFLGGRSTLEGAMSVGELTQFIAYAGILYGPLGWMTSLPRRITFMLNSMERIYDILDEVPDITDRENAKEWEINGDISFENVSFGYDSYDPVLENVSLDVKAGEMIGLVGPSGAGKSTLINLIMHLYNPDAGRILLDGEDIRQIKGGCLHRQIGVVLQETFLFSGTVLNNIRFARPEATLEEVIRAAKMANAHDFLCKLPDGYNTYVGEKGYTLSGGERQRIAIARAILNNPRLLILDEATASLDTESEFLIQQALKRLTEGRTTFAIAHRLSTLREADRLMVIDKRRVVESGTHNELLALKGVYYGLVNAQLQMHSVHADEENCEVMAAETA